MGPEKNIFLIPFAAHYSQKIPAPIHSTPPKSRVRCTPFVEVFKHERVTLVIQFRLNVPLCLLLAFVFSASTFASQLTDEEQKAGWKLLFDGKTTTGWRNLGKTTFPEKGWDVVDGCLHHIPKGGGGDITFNETFENFEFSFEWKAAPGTNSGVKYRVVDKPGSAFGPEYQIIDDEKHADAKNPKRTAGALYDIFAPAKERVVKPVGEFNSSKLVVNGNRIEHWLNGIKVVDAEVGAEAWTQAIAASKFAKTPTFGSNTKGHIVLQDHQDEVWFRNLKIRAITK
jgi:Domain of Unknown Function (DUF1080)